MVARQPDDPGADPQPQRRGPPSWVLVVGACGGIGALIAAGTVLVNTGHLEGAVTTQIAELSRRISVLEAQAGALSSIDRRLARIEGKLDASQHAGLQ